MSFVVNHSLVEKAASLLKILDLIIVVVLCFLSNA